ncbi:MAG: alpha-2-macroglobulin family protein [Planctomycetota bacterium]|jgi:uncharacterized protein YfaS (alpha-2-macroglobulin family)/tetratricopeptide (TPR) repeat protein
MKMRRMILGVLAGVLALTFCYWSFAEREDPLEEGLKQFAKHNYKDALVLFRKALKGELPDREGIGLKVIICLGKLRQWDEAVKEADAFIKEHKETFWEARGMHLKGNLLFERPHYGYRTKEGKFTRGRHVRGGYYVETEKEDIEGAVKSLEGARALYTHIHSRVRLEAEENKKIRAERAELNMDLARVLEGAVDRWQFRRWLEEKKADQAATAEGPYNPAWPVRVKVAFCYGAVETLDDSEDKHLSAVARYRKALFFRRVGPLRDSEKPLPILDGLLKAFPKDSIADEALFVTGMILEVKEDFLGAKARYERLAKTYPESKWNADGKARIREMARPRIIVDSSGVRLPGGVQEVKVRSRNLKKIGFTAFPVKLEKVFEDSRNDASRWWNYFERFLQDGGAREYWDIQSREWDFATTDAGDHKWVEGTMKVPVRGPGAYVLEARGESVMHTSVLVISDLALIRKMDGTRLFVFATDAVTGKGVPGVSLAVRKKFWVNRRYRTEYSEGKTGEDGLFVQTLNPEGNRNKNIQVLAWSGNRYAATGMRSWYWQSGGIAPQVRVYAYTDRPVYRPDQTVHFKALFRLKEGGEYRNLAGRDVQVDIRDTKGKKIFDEVLKTNEFGGVNGKVKLGAEPPLGVYRIRVKVPGQRRVSLARGSQFRVEEYKKPEYEVTISTEKPQVKLGSAFRAKINARYYFGAPVTDADVTFRVFRKNYRHRYVPTGEFDWLYGRGYGWRPWWWYIWGPMEPPKEEMVLSGSAKTDAEGNAFVEIDSSKFAEIGKDLGEKAPDHLFTVKAEVRDASRRTIEGSGQIKVTRSEYYAFIETPRGFFEKGERAKFEIRTQNAMGAPVKAKGKIEVSLLIPPKEGSEEDAKPERKVLFEEPCTTDAEGRAWFQFVPDKEGRFEVAFRSKDSWGGEVVGRREIWSVGEEFEGWRFRFAHVEILTDRRSYEEGDTARIMVNTNHRGAHVFFTLEAGNEILTHRILAMDAKSQIVPVKIEKHHVPNLFARAALFAGGMPYREDWEMFVPPAKQFLDVSVNAGKGEYKPGEKATYRVKVSDRRGEPVQCEVSLGVIDRSVLYIQSEFAPDVRKYFYGDLRRLRVYPDNSKEHGFSRYEADSAYYPDIKTHGNPPGWWGYGHWRDALGEEQNLTAGVRFDKRRSKSKGEKPGAPMYDEEAEGEDGGGGDAWGFAAGKEAKSGEHLARGRRALGNVGDPGGPGAEEKEPEVRKNFADTAFWAPTSVTGEDGTVKFEFTMPDSLTSWKATAVAADRGSRVGNGTHAVVTKKNLIVRLAAPRFFTERDEVALSGIVNNYLSTSKDVRFEILLEGGCLEAMGETSVRREVAANGTGRVDFWVKAVKDGKASVTIRALTDEESDAMKLTFPVLVHGIQKAVTVTGVMRPETKDHMTIRLKVPKERDPAASSLELTVSPSIASCMLDALPYLIEYPYGCVEQTMSRFLPAVTVARTLKELGLDLETIGRKRAEIDAAHLADRIKRGWHKLPDPVFDTQTLNLVVRQGLARIATFQKSDGGFGWWAGSRSDPYMTAYVVYGLTEARKAGYTVNDMQIGRALGFLKHAFREDESLHRRAYIGWVLAHAGTPEAEDLDALFARRDDLNHYTKCLLAMTLHRVGRKKEAKTVLENVLQFVTVDKENGTCFIDTGARFWWLWYNDRIEATVFLLRAMLAISPNDDHAPMIVKWLVNNRKGGRWSSTKDTANAIYALAEYIRAEDELNPEYTVTVDWPGVGKKAFHVTRKNVLSFDNLFLIEGEAIPAGEHEITVTREGKGSVYLTAHLSYFSKEEDIKGAGHELFVARSFYRMIPKKKTVEREGRKIEVLDWERVALKPGESVKSGERIEVRLDIEAKNRYEYLVFEDMKPAGLEPVQLRSGFSYGNLCSNMELRDEKVVFFTDSLETGKHVITYEMRAEVPGRFHALPTKAYAMYAPKVGGISDEWRLEIKD